MVISWLLGTIIIALPFECMDAAPETVVGGHADHNGALIHHMEPRCGSLPCPPNVQEREMTCCGTLYTIEL